jgi:hypothetical protein
MGCTTICSRRSCETTGKRIVRRVLSTEPPTVEVTFEDGGSVLGVATSGIEPTPPASAPMAAFMEGPRANHHRGWQVVTWKGSGRGRLEPAVRRAIGASVLQTGVAEAKIERRAGRIGRVDPASTHSKVWAWK